MAHLDESHPVAHTQMVQLYVSKLIESGKKEEKEHIAETLLLKAKKSFESLSFSEPDKLASMLRVFEFDMQLVLLALRDFNINLKDKGTQFMVTVSKTIYTNLSKHAKKYKVFTPSISQEALKSLDPGEKELIN